jgi:hypothetical protein
VNIFPETNSQIPFSVVCEWNEFMDFSNKKEAPYPSWVNYYVYYYSYEIDEIKITDEKWGYCRAETGEMVIPPQWEWCDDFVCDFAIVKCNGKYGVINTSGDFLIDPDFMDIKRAGQDDIFFVKNEIGKWGAFDFNDYRETPVIGYNWDDIWWDGFGGFTVMEKTSDGRELYGIVNAKNKIVAQNLTEKPVRYYSSHWETRQNTYRDGEQYNSFRIIKNGEKYGIVLDEYNDTEGSWLLHEPIHTYEFILEAAAKKDMEWEIFYYARLITKIPADVANAWENVPQDIIKDVRAYMKKHEWEQGSWI